jgi:hypothetical protein
MPLISASSKPIKASVVAAVYLLSLELAGDAPLPTTAAEAIGLANAGRSQAYAMLGRLRQGAELLARPAGRPAMPSPDGPTLAKLSAAVLAFVMAHPGCCNTTNETRAYYHGSFRRFVVGLFAPGCPAAEIPVQQVAPAIGVPLGTLKDWLHAELCKPAPGGDAQRDCSPCESAFSVAQPQIATLLAEYPKWKGCLSDFCEYTRTELRLPFGRGFITTVLSAAGLHTPKLRNRPHQAPWSRGSMQLGFPGMQWFGDGKQLGVVFRNQTFQFNIEAFVDGASSATVGALVTNAEDAAAVVGTFYDGLFTVEGQVPMAVTLDNRPSNFAPQVEQTLSCTELLRATSGRGQAKAPVEGAFGLFEQAMPGSLLIKGDDDRVIAGSVANLVVRAFYLGRNGRPSHKLGGLSAAQAYLGAKPTEEQIEEAKQWILELRRREQIARTSRERRTDPIRRELLEKELQRLGIDDPKGRISLSLAGYSMNAILTGLAIFDAKRANGSLPKDCQLDRYLGGIIRNCEDSQLLESMGRKLLGLRLSVADAQMEPLRAEAAKISAAANDPSQRTRSFVGHALDADSTLAFRFWCSQALKAISHMPRSDIPDLCDHFRRVIAAAFRVDIRRRQQLLADLLAAAVPVVA